LHGRAITTFGWRNRCRCSGCSLPPPATHKRVSEQYGNSIALVQLLSPTKSLSFRPGNNLQVPFSNLFV
uniref:Ovule protein n=1 Tax=Taenia asiatica TaxID=60517 RepID=A0A0R3W044_TAEAS